MTSEYCNRDWVREIFNLSRTFNLDEEIPSRKDWFDFLRPFSYNVNEKQRQSYIKNVKQNRGNYKIKCSDGPLHLPDRYICTKSEYFGNNKSNSIKLLHCSRETLKVSIKSIMLRANTIAFSLLTSSENSKLEIT